MFHLSSATREAGRAGESDPQVGIQTSEFSVWGCWEKRGFASLELHLREVALGKWRCGDSGTGAKFMALSEW